MADKVLLVDDEEDFLEVMAERMRARGFDVTTSSTASEALEMIEKVSYDAVILDFMMPGMDGFQTLEEIKERRPESQIILLTGYATLEKGVEAMKLGATDFIEKPADLEKLTEKIKAAKTKKMLIVEKQTEQNIKKLLQRFGF
jgi:DNA-binding NtrC family response regulator